MTFSLPGFDLDAFVGATLAEDLGEGGDITSEAVIPANARFRGVMDSRDAIVVAGLPIAEAFFRTLDPEVEIVALAEDGQAVAAGSDLLRLGGTRAGDAHRRAIGAQHGAAPVRHRDADPALCRCNHRHGGDPSRHAQDHSRPAHAWRSTRPGWAARRTTAWACGTRR
jgi:hypothetical protein